MSHKKLLFLILELEVQRGLDRILQFREVFVYVWLLSWAKCVWEGEGVVLESRERDGRERERGIDEELYKNEGIDEGSSLLDS